MTEKMTRTEAVDVLRHVLSAVYDTIAESGENGAPGGSLYAALMSHGVSYDTFNSIMAALIARGLVTKRGDCYFVPPKYVD